MHVQQVEQADEALLSHGQPCFVHAALWVEEVEAV